MENKLITGMDSILNENRKDAVLELIKLLPGQRLPVNQFRVILFDGFLDSPDHSNSLDALLYIHQLLKDYPLEDFESQKYYTNVLFQQTNIIFWWCHLLEYINCCFQKCGMDGKSCGKNCLHFLKYVIKVIQSDHVFLMKKGVLSDTQSHPRSIISNIFWPNKETSQPSKYIHILVTYIDDIFAVGASGDKLELLKLLVTLLGMATDCMIGCLEFNLCKVFTQVPCNSIMKLMEVICSCPNIWCLCENLKLFLTFLPSSWLKVLVCWSILNQMIYRTWNYVQFPVSVQKMNCFIVPNNEQNDQNMRLQSEEQSNLSSSSSAAQSVTSISSNNCDLTSVTTQLQEDLCIKKKRGRKKRRGAIQPLVTTNEKSCAPEELHPTVVASSSQNNFPVFGSLEECKIYLFCFHHLLVHYVNFFQLTKLCSSSESAVKQHLEEHFHCQTADACASHLEADIRDLNSLLKLVDRVIANLETTGTELRFDLEFVSLTFVIASLTSSLSFLSTAT